MSSGNGGASAERDAFVRSQLDAAFKRWLRRASLWGAAVFLGLSTLDYVSTPENFRDFFLYRLAASLLLVVIALLSKLLDHRDAALHRGLAYLAVLGSSAAVEAMILRFGGHASPYYVGMVLLGVCVIGFIPARTGFHVRAVLLIYAAYLLPILYAGGITEPRAFTASNIFLASIFASMLLVRHLNEKTRVEEAGLKYDMSRQHLNLEREVVERTLKLSDANRALESEVAARRKTEESLQNYTLTLERYAADLMRAEERLREGEARYRLLFEKMLNGLAYCRIVVDAGGKAVDYVFVDVNEAFERFTGLRKADILGRRATEVMPGIMESGFDWAGNFGRAALRGEELVFDRYVEPLGRWFAFYVYSPAPEHFVTVFDDITERKRSMDDLRSAMRDWADTFDTITDMITIHDKDFNIIHANKAAEKILGLPFLKDMKAKCFKYYHGAEAPPRNCPSCECLNTAEPSASEVFEPHLGRFVEIRAIPRRNQEGRVIGLIHIVRDISERKRLEESTARQLARLRSLRTIDMAITSSLDLDLTLKVFVEQVRSQLGVDAASVMLFNPRLQSLSFAAGSGFRTDRIKRVSLKLGESLAGTALLNRQKVVVTDLSKLDAEFPGKAAPYRFTEAFLVREEGIAAYFGVPLMAKGQINGILEIFHRRPLEPDDDWLEFLDALAGQAAIAIDNASLFMELQRSRDELIMAYDKTIEGWSKALDYRDKETEGHSQRVAELTMKIGRAMGLGEEQLLHMRRGALLHDIGKLGVPDSILLKEECLDHDEMEVMKEHAEIGYRLLSSIDFLREAIDIPYCHHEKWDGSGYPRGLRGEEIPLSARIFAVADVWDALRSDRPYRKALSREDALAHIRFLSGVHLDPRVTEAFLRVEAGG